MVRFQANFDIYKMIKPLLRHTISSYLTSAASFCASKETLKNSVYARLAINIDIVVRLIFECQKAIKAQ